MQSFLCYNRRVQFKKGGKDMRELKQKALDLIHRYDDQLAAKGIKIILSEKHVETAVPERSGGYGSSQHAIFRIFERAYDRKKEKHKGYQFQNNRYHSLVICIVPLDPKLAHRKIWREYAFVCRKVERAHLGDTPEKTIYDEDKVLSKIEKRILIILKQANYKTAEQVCQDTLWDALRYLWSPKYKYKNKFCGKDRDTWELFFMFVTVAIAVLIIAIVWTTGKILN